MARAFKCRGCGEKQPHIWKGPCPLCFGAWDIQTISVEGEDGEEVDDFVEGEVIAFQDAVNMTIKQKEYERVKTGVDHIDKVLGGGFVPGSVVLFTGSPGSGKSTINVQMCQLLAKRKVHTLYVSGEESVAQLAQRYKNVGKFKASFEAVHLTSLDDILEEVSERKPTLVIIDSIQVIDVGEEYEIGGTGAIKAAIREFSACAKSEKITFVIVGHVTKGGAIGGPRALEHLADVAIHLRGNPLDAKRVLECHNKNRFGKTPEEAVFEMTAQGLVPVYEEDAEKIEAIPLAPPPVESLEVEKPVKKKRAKRALTA
jgi:DNA repair protein RadA/Sms